jgi:hypothetical protein
MFFRQRRNKMELRTFTKPYECHLANLVTRDIPGTRRRYRSKEAWVDPTDESIPSGIEVPEGLWQSIEGGQENDLQNSRLLHKALPLTPAMAENRCLWARLAHVELWHYMKERWNPKELLNHQEEGGERRDKKLSLFLRRRYFVMKRNNRDLMRNGIARLWWAAELTKDAEGSYKDTQVLLWMPEVAERQYGQYPLVLKTLLRFIASARNELIGEGIRNNLRSHYFRPLLKRFNQHGGSVQLGQLGRSGIESLLDTDFEYIRSKVPVRA